MSGAGMSWLAVTMVGLSALHLRGMRLVIAWLIVNLPVSIALNRWADSKRPS